MKQKLLLLFMMVLSINFVSAQNAWINEIHYDNDGGDIAPGIEIVIENPSSYTLSDFTVTCYNGNGGASYSPETADNFTAGNTEGNFTFYVYSVDMQNGAPDGLCIDYQGTVLQFLSYEGTFTAVGGPADELTSTDIGVSETGSTPVGESLQLSGNGTQYSEFTWQVPATATAGALNNGQTFGVVTTPIISNITIAPLAPTHNDAVTVSADITDDGTIASASISWGLTSGTYDQGTYSMTVVSAPNYVAESNIPAQAAGTTVYYIVTAIDDTPETTVSAEQSYTVVANATEVATIAELRLGATDGTLYELTGEAFISYLRDYRNQKYIQDATAGILIDDNDDIITTTYLQFDGVTGITGTLNTHNGLLQFIPTLDPGVATTTPGTEISPELTTIDAVNTTIEAYESELVVINAVTFADAGATFAAGQNYNVTDGTNTIVFRTNFSEADYIGTTIPTSCNITALAAEFNGTVQIIARDLADIELIVLSNPVISNIVNTPGTPNSTQTVSVSATVTDDVSLSDVAVYWSLTTPVAPSDNMIPMTAAGDVYTTDSDIPAQLNGVTVFYVVVATDGDDNETVSAEQSYTVFDMPAGALFFSEYIEGSGNNKALEIYNGTGDAVDLSDYVIKQSLDGEGWGVDGGSYYLALPAVMLEDGDVFVIGASDATSTEILAATDLALTYGDDPGAKVIFFTGNDALGLFLGDALVDVIGVPSESAYWEVAGVTDATDVHTLVRKFPQVTIGNIDWASSAGTTAENSEWEVYDIDNFSFIGWHGEISEDPTLTVTSPAEGSTIIVNSVEVAFAVTNFVLGTDGEVAYTIDGGTTVETTDLNAISFTELADGNYTVDLELVDMDGLSIDPAVTASVNFTIDTSNAVDNINNAVSIYPNPSNGLFNINANGNFNMQVIDITGKVIDTKNFSNNTTIEINTTGIYFIKLSDGNSVSVQKVIVK